MAHAMQTPLPVRQLEPTVPEGLQKVVGVLLAKDPGQRYATPAKAAQALASFLPKQVEPAVEVSSLTASYLQWVESQGLEEVNAAALPAQRWCYAHKGKPGGPVASAQLAQLASSGTLDPDDIIWMEGDDRSLGIPAKAAISFPSLPRAKRGTQQNAGPHRNTSRQPGPAGGSADSGFDAETGRVLDPEKFRRWQKEQKRLKDELAAAGPTSFEQFLKARVHLDRWLDFDRNRRPILAGDTEFIRQDRDIQRFMQHYARYGPEMVHKLWQYLQFMVENRRKYYCALGLTA
jgi:hypothetical protein